MATSTSPGTSERDEILKILAEQRDTLRITVRGISDAQAAECTTASALCLGGLIKHVTLVERFWLSLVAGRPEPQASGADWADGFRMGEGETLAGVLAEYEAVARETERIAANLGDLNQTSPLPEAPWFEPGAAWSARRILLHLIRETAQHAGHADIIRESLDGANTTMRMAADVGMKV